MKPARFKRNDFDIETLLKKSRISYRQGKTKQALNDLKKILGVSPKHAEALHRTGLIAWHTGNFQKAEKLLCRAVDSYSREPSTKISKIAKVYYNLGLILLTQGRFKEGWSHLEWRLRLTNAYFSAEIPPKPVWDGSDLGGQKLLLQAEGGFGDTLQFVRYAKILARNYASLILFCHPQLARLFKISGGLGKVIPEGSRLPSFDVYCPFFSLPKIFGTTQETVPRNIPYLKANPKEVKGWREFFAEPGLHVGLVWAGEPHHRIDRRRSMALKELTPLFDIANINFYSLQLGNAVKQLKQFIYSKEIVDLSPLITDFADTAAIISALDLLITVDTAPAHLAGALGRPVWVMLPGVADWRWMTECEDSPWYPTMRLFRQTTPGDWSKVVERIHDALRKHKN